MSVTASTKVGKAFEEPSGPFHISSPYRVCKVTKFDSQKATHFAQVLDRPPCGSRAELIVQSVDFRAVLN